MLGLHACERGRFRGGREENQALLFMALTLDPGAAPGHM